MQTGFASCEWINSDESLWWITDYGKGSGLKVLKNSRFPIDLKTDLPSYSQIDIFRDYGFLYNNDELDNKVSIKIDFTYDNWSKTAYEILNGEKIDQKFLNSCFHYKFLRQKSNSNIELPSPRIWYVTGILLDHLSFCIVSNKWQFGKPGPKEAFTFHHDTFEQFIARLNHFEVVAFESKGTRPLIPHHEWEEFERELNK